MLKRMKRKFVIATMAALIMVITLIVGTINAFNYHSILDEADAMLELIMNNAGRFPDVSDDEEVDSEVNITPESPFESRYFTVVFKDGKLKKVDTASIAAIDDYTATEMTKKILAKGESRGFITRYRYMVREVDGETTVVYLDCTRTLDNASTFFILSIFISLVGLAIIFMLLWVIADRVVTPLTEGYEKQKRFVTNAGHDIKTPITIINADAELLEMEIGDNEWLMDIKKQSERLATLTGDLIYLSRMDEEAYAPHIDFPLSEVLEETVASFSAPAKKKQITIDCNISPAVFCNGDENAIKKLCSILMDNAIKYSPKEELIEVSLKKSAKGNLLRITNAAHGLDDDALKHLFDRFYRKDEARSSAGGFGIGLSVASAIVSAHKGRISAEIHDDRLTIEVII